MAARGAQWAHDLFVPLADFLADRCNVVGFQSDAMDRSEKRAQQNQIHIKAELILQNETFVLDRACAINRDGEIPERRAHAASLSDRRNPAAGVRPWP